MHSITLPSTPVRSVGLFPLWLFLFLLTLLMVSPAALVIFAPAAQAAENAAVPVDDLEYWLGDDDSEAPDEAKVFSPRPAWRWRASTGLEFSEGDYGTTEQSDAWIQSATLKASKGPWSFGLSGSYQWITGPALNPLIFDDLDLFFEEYLDTGALFVQQSHEGFGDVSVSARYAPSQPLVDGWYPSVSLKVKMPVAEAALSTGKTDVTLTGDLAKAFGRESGKQWSVFALASHTFRGDSLASPRRNTFAGSLGADYRVSPKWNAGLSYDLRETSSVSGGVSSSVFAYGRYKVTPKVSVLGYTAVGLDNNGPDTTVGMRMSWSGLW